MHYFCQHNRGRSEADYHKTMFKHIHFWKSSQDRIFPLYFTIFRISFFSVIFCSFCWDNKTITTTIFLSLKLLIPPYLLFTSWYFSQQHNFCDKYNAIKAIQSNNCGIKWNVKRFAVVLHLLRRRKMCRCPNTIGMNVLPLTVTPKNSI